MRRGGDACAVWMKAAKKAKCVFFQNEQNRESRRNHVRIISVLAKLKML